MMTFLPDIKVSADSKLLNKRWKQGGITIAGGSGQGEELYQLSSPHSLCLTDDGAICIADCSNDRIVEWRSSRRKGHVVAGGYGKGNRLNQLHSPTDVIVDRENDSLIIADRDNQRVMRWSRQNTTTKGEIVIPHICCSRLTMSSNGSLYVSDWKKNEVRRWRREEKGNGTIVAGGNGEGDHLNQLHHPTFIFVDDEESLYVSDNNNHRVMKWAKHATEGVIVAGGNGSGSSLKQLFCPQGVTVDQIGQVFVADWGNHRVICWPQGATEGRIVVSRTGQSDSLNHPKGLLLDEKQNLYVADCDNHCIQKFEIE